MAFKEKIETTKSVLREMGMVLRLGFDIRTDPMFISAKEEWKDSRLDELGRPQSFGKRMKQTVLLMNKGI